MAEDAITLRPYQRDAIYETIGSLRRYDRVLLSCPTGSGKSVMLAYLANAWSETLAADYGLPQRVLWIAHREELIDQAAEHCELATGQKVAVEMGERSLRKTPALSDSPVVVASVQTMSRDNRMTFFRRNSFGLCIVDESHHAINDSYAKVIDYFAEAKIVGATATADRHDEKPLGQLFKHVAYHYSIVDAIDDGWLAPVRQEFIEVEGLDWSTVRLDSTGDLSAEDLGRVIQQEEALHAIVAPAVRAAGNRPTLIFTPTVQTAKLISGLIPRYSDRGAEYVCAMTPRDERRGIVERFRSGDFQFLANCGVFLEGTDFPRVSCIVMARPTASRMLYAQMAGRGLRGGPAAPVAGKTDCLIVDLVGVSKKHKLCTTVDLLGADQDTTVLQEAMRYLRDPKRKSPGDVAEAIREAAAIADELQAAERRRIVAEARARRTQIDPFLVFAEAMQIKIRNEPGWWTDIPADQEQVERLKRAGIPPDGLTAAEARQLLKAVGTRIDNGLCTYKMARMLRSRGFDADMTMAEASIVMSWMQRRPGGFAFCRDDGIRLSMAKRRSSGLKFAELRWKYTIEKGVKGTITRGDGQWAEYQTTKRQTFNSFAESDASSLVFERDGYLLRVLKSSVSSELIGWKQGGI